MRIDKRKPCDSPQAEPRTQPIDEIGKVLAVFSRCEPIRLILIVVFDRKGREAQDIETEARVERIIRICVGANSLDLFAEEPRDHLRIAQRAARAGEQMFHRPVDAVEAHVETPRAFAMPRQEMRKLLRKSEDRRLDGFALADRLGKAPLGQIRGRFEAWRNRRLEAPEHGVELLEEGAVETRRERGARTQQNIADPPQSRLPEFGQGFLVEPQGGERQCAEAAGDLLFGAIWR